MNSNVSTTTLEHSKFTVRKRFSVKEVLRCLLALFTLFSCNYAISAINVSTSGSNVTINWPGISSPVDYYSVLISPAVGSQWEGQCWEEGISGTNFSIDANSFLNGCAFTGDFTVTVYPYTSSWEWDVAASETQGFSVGTAGGGINVSTSGSNVTINWPGISSPVDYYSVLISPAVGSQWEGQCWEEGTSGTNFSIDANSFLNGCAFTGDFTATVYPYTSSWEWDVAASETQGFSVGTAGGGINVSTSGSNVTINWSGISSPVDYYSVLISPAAGSQWEGQCWEEGVSGSNFSIDANSFLNGCVFTGDFIVTVYPYTSTWEWDVAASETKSFSIDVDGSPPSNLPVFSYSELIGNAPARPNYSLANLAAITPNLPVDATIPSLSIINAGICSNSSVLQMDENTLPAPPTSVGGQIDWRNNTNRNNPIIWMIAAADDTNTSNLSPSAKEQIWNTVNERFARLLAESLPMSSRIDSRNPIFNNEDELSNFRFKAGVYDNSDEGPVMEHFLISYLIPYAELVKNKDNATFNAAKKAIQGYARWLASLKTDLHGANGPAFIVGASETGDVNHHDSVRITNFRAWMRLFKNMVLFSESRFVKEIGLDDELVIEANKMLNWLDVQQAGGSSDLHKVGWTNLQGVPTYYFGVGTAIRPNPDTTIPGQRHVWTRFLELWHGVLEQVRNTAYYKQNKHNGVMDRLIAKTKDATTGIVKSSVNYAVPTVSNNLLPSFTNYRAHAWYLDITSFNECDMPDNSGKCHEVFSNTDSNENITPKDFFQNYNLTDFKEHISHICDYAADVTWYRYLPATISAYTRLK